MGTSAAKSFSLPWNQYEHYWICLSPMTESVTGLAEAAASAGMQPRQTDRGAYFIFKAPREWGEAWNRVTAALGPLSNAVEAAVIGSDAEPTHDQIAFSRRTVSAIDTIANSLWLGEALLRGDVLCYLQPVMNARDKVFGYESFARARALDGTIIGGDKIVIAAKALGIEYAIDRHLHVQAIKTFVSGDVSGFLFINFFPGFIQRPEVYLEGLSEAARLHGLISKYLVLDFTQSELPHDMTHLKRVTDYCRSKGYALALDDIECAENAQKLVTEIRPDYVKLDRALVQRSKRVSDLDVIRTIVSIAHEGGAAVIAEGVETQESFDSLKTLQVDLFQGYHFSPPVPVETVLKQNKAG